MVASEDRQDQRLDPRISELILQAIDDRSENSSDMFLHALIEDPTRSSVWKQSSRIRYLGYSCLELYLPIQRLDRFFQEVFRKDDRTARKEIESLDELQILAHALCLFSLITVLREYCPHNGYTDPLDL